MPYHPTSRAGASPANRLHNTFARTAWTIAAVACVAAPALAFGWDGSEKIHGRLTRYALPFMTDDALGTVVAGNHDEDQGDEQYLTQRHSQSCRFRDNANYVNMRYNQVVDAVLNPVANDRNRGPRLFGHLLHGIQDFYAHSNYAGTPPEGLGIRGRLFDDGLSFWTLRTPYTVVFDDVMIVEGNPPPGVTVRLPADAQGKVSSAVPVITDSRSVTGKGGGPSRFATRRYRGLMTSVAGSTITATNQLCPPAGSDGTSSSPDDVGLRHAEGRKQSDGVKAYAGEGRLNYDRSGGGDWQAARHLAMLQTMHEWCRLLHIARQRDSGLKAAGIILATWVGYDMPDKTAHIAGTACQRTTSGSTRVEITATPAANAPQPTIFVAFRGDFKDSVRAVAQRNAATTVRLCAPPGALLSAALHRGPMRGPTAAFAVPPQAQTWTTGGAGGAFGAIYRIRVLPNGC